MWLFHHKRISMLPFKKISFSDSTNLQHAHIKNMAQIENSKYKNNISPTISYSETCIKRPLNFVVSQDRWSLTTGRINMLLYRPSQANDEIYVFLVRLSRSHYAGSTVYNSGLCWAVDCSKYVSHTCKIMAYWNVDILVNNGNTK